MHIRDVVTLGKAAAQSGVKSCLVTADLNMIPDGCVFRKKKGFLPSEWSVLLNDA